MSNLKVRIISAPSKAMPKSNGGSYVLQNGEITEGPAKGHVIAVSRTILNKENAALKAAGEEFTAKEPFELNQEVTVYPRQVQAEDGRVLTFFEGQGSTSASAEEATDILKLAGIEAEVAEEAPEITA